MLRFTGKSKLMVLGGEEGLEFGVCVEGICLERVSEFKYLNQSVAKEMDGKHNR